MPTLKALNKATGKNYKRWYEVADALREPIPEEEQVYELRQWCREHKVRFVKIFKAYGFTKDIENYDPKIHGSDPTGYYITREKALEAEAYLEEREKRWKN